MRPRAPFSPPRAAPTGSLPSRRLLLDLDAPRWALRGAASGLLALVSFLALLVVGCDETSGDRGAAAPASASAPPPAAKPPVELVVAYGSEKKTWIEGEIKAFQSAGPKTAGGRPIAIKAQAMGSGEAVSGIVAGTLKPHVFAPASALYVSMLNAAWAQKTGRPKPLSPAGEPLVLSPIVVAIWKPMAEALGWPEKSIGWSDLLKINADPKGWGAKGHPEWGRFKLGHTHPEYSSSGFQSILAEVYAGAKKTRGLTAQDLEQKPTQEMLAKIEQTIVHYGKSTGFFADKMVSRGPSYMSAAVLYENLIIESYSKGGAAPFPLVAIYPTEGTFWSDHPFAVLDADWVGADEREAADAFLKFLKSKPAQTRALGLGFRPGDPSIPMGAPIDAAHGVDPKQPQTLLELPSSDLYDKLLDLWRSMKKPSDVIIVFDTSGSMSGQPLAQAKGGAKAFLESLQERDEASLVFFNGTVYPTIGPKKVGASRGELEGRVDMQIADGKTALYDAIAQAYDTAKARADQEPAIIHAVVVMTDGKDEGSKLTLPALTSRLGGAGWAEGDHGVRIFTIAYGAGADPTVLAQVAEAAGGTTAKGDTATIVDVFKDMAAFF